MEKLSDIISRVLPEIKITLKSGKAKPYRNIKNETIDSQYDNWLLENQKGWDI